MSILKNKGSKINAIKETILVEEPIVSFKITDSEFLIRLILSNKIDGKDVETCSSVLRKIKKIHEVLVSKKQGVL
jgi:hypothetical protein